MLNRAQIEAQRFLKKLQEETDKEFPAGEYTRVAVGSAITPLAAVMRQAGGLTTALPLELNNNARLWELFDLNLPGLTDKKAVFMLYSEKAGPVVIFSRLLQKYLSEKHISPKKIQIHVFTSQMVFREMRLALAQNIYTLRPIGAANLVRHWFHNGEMPGSYNYSQFPVFDGRGRARVEQIPPEGQPFTRSVEDSPYMSDNK
jgi:hypothetical protein